MELGQTMRQLAERAKEASWVLASLKSETKNQVLIAMADALTSDRLGLQEENLKDLAVADEMGLSSAMKDRLKLTDARIKSMAEGLRYVATLPDPVGRLLDERRHANGMVLKKMATPIGVIVIIYESRPNVTADAASLCLKAGNATILRGGKEAFHSNHRIAEVMVEAARRVVPEFPEHGIQLVPTTDREAIRELLQLTEYVDLCIPRGGEGLIRAVSACSAVPVIKHYKGVCHVYVAPDADLEMAKAIVVNAKVQRPGVCNAMETLLVDEAILDSHLPALAQCLLAEKVQLRVDEKAMDCLKSHLGVQANALGLATEEDWSAEYLDLILSIKTVKGLSDAIQHINRYGSGHSDAIITPHPNEAQQFLDEVDSAVVYWNASTRFTDGGEFGMGAEIGISTDKIGARGPMGLEELTTYKWLVTGTGQIRP